MLDALRRQPPEWRKQASAALRDGAAREHVLIYSDSKTSQPVPIHLVPLLVTATQCRYLHYLGVRIRRTLNRVLKAYHDDPALRAVLPLTDDEAAWFAELIPKGFPEPFTVFERFDTNLMIDDPDWLTHFRCLEFNALGIGCLHFMPVANQLATEHVLPGLQETLGTLPHATADCRVLLRQTLEAHAKATGRKRCVVAFVERRETAAGGADEMQDVSVWLKAQGMETVMADPRDLELKAGEVMYKDTVIDVLYRDFALSEIISIEKHGGAVPAMKHAFKNNQVVSSLVGEFDHKSLLELLSNPEFDRYFTPSQRRTNRTFIPWTRLVRERRTTDPDGKETDLLEYMKAHREVLVVKPNRAYGGENVVIGVDVAQHAWEEAIVTAMAKPDSCVVQEIARIPQLEFPGDDGKDTVKEFVTVGFIATSHGIAFLGRSAGDRVVNITRGGGLVPVFRLG